MANLYKIVSIGSLDLGFSPWSAVFCKITMEEGRLSISGVVGPKRNGNCEGSCGQIGESVKAITEFFPDWNAELRDRFVEVWDKWHLNNMRPGCSHQMANWDTGKRLEVVSYGLTTEAVVLRKSVLERVAKAYLMGKWEQFSNTERALGLLENWYKDVFSPPDADDPLSGFYEVKKRETKDAGWVSSIEHPEGLLGKACEVCGHKYGSDWQFEAIPEDVVSFLVSLPESKLTPVWV